MAKFQLGARPKTFHQKVKFDTLDGVSSELNITYHYRSKTEFFELVDELLAAAKARGIDAEDKPLSEVVTAADGDNAKYILKIVAGWDLDDELNEANVRRLGDEYPAAATAIVDSYRLACVEGKRGN